MADWEGLQHGLLVLILKKINLIEDFAAFGMVCKSWHAAAATNKQYLRPQTPWLMVPITGAKAEAQIFSLTKQERLTKNLYIPEMSTKKCIGLNYGWILTISLKGDMNLLHPLSRVQIQLPPRQTIMEGNIYDNGPPHAFLKKAALSANPSESPSDFVLMIAYSLGNSLSYWRPGSKRWTNAGAAGFSDLTLFGDLSVFNDLPGFDDLTYHQDRFYAITHIGAVWSWIDLGPHQDPIFAHNVSKVDRRSTTASQVGSYVVAGSTPHSVFVLVCFRDGWNVKHLKIWFQVYELDLTNGGYNEIKSLGDRAIFVGDNTSVILENASEYPGVDPNHIYFTNDSDPFPREKEVGGCYNPQDGQTTHFRVDISSRMINPPFWFVPSF